MNLDGTLNKRTLVLGCGNKPYAGATNQDLTKHSPYVDKAYDLNGDWPELAGSYDVIVAEDVLEHLDDFIHFFDEAWRVLADGGRIVVQVPRWDSENCWRDPTHKRGYHVDCFRYLDPDTLWGKKYGMYTVHKWKVERLTDGDNIVSVLRKRGKNEVPTDGGHGGGDDGDERGGCGSAQLQAATE